MDEARTDQQSERLFGPAHASARGRQAPAPRIEFSTSELPLHDQFDAYRSWMGEIGEFRPIGSAEGYSASQVIWDLGRLTLVNERCGAIETRLKSARNVMSIADHWVLTLHKSGRTVVKSDSHVRGKRPGSLGFVTMTKFAHARQSSGETLYLFVPRECFPHAAGAFDTLHNANLAGASAQLIVDYMLALERLIDRLDTTTRSRAADAAIELMEACLLEHVTQQQRTNVDQRAFLREKALRFIRDNVEVCPNPSDVARHLGVSRSALYRLFEQESGVAHLILTERLGAARLALINPGDSRRINQVALDLGFRTPEEFSRAFRREFGVAPRETFVRSSRGGEPD